MTLPSVAAGSLLGGCCTLSAGLTTVVTRLDQEASQSDHITELPPGTGLGQARDERKSLVLRRLETEPPSF